MITLTQSVTIQRPIGVVFDFVSTRANLPRWFSGVVSAVQPEPTAVGATASVTAKVMGMTMTATNAITAFERNATFAFAGSTPFPSHESETFSIVDGGTRLDYVGTFEPTGVYRLLQPVLRSLLSRQIRQSFDRLKSLLESNSE